MPEEGAAGPQSQLQKMYFISLRADKTAKILSGCNRKHIHAAIPERVNSKCLQLSKKKNYFTVENEGSVLCQTNF